VRRGDTLSAIAARFYGDGAHYRAIYRANRGKIRNPNLIYPRQHLYIP
jgi:nucleoid-associated protein YgaU